MRFHNGESATLSTIDNGSDGVVTKASANGWRIIKVYAEGRF